MDTLSFWYAGVAIDPNPFFPSHPGSCNGVNGPKKSRLGTILWESAAICSLKLSFCHAHIIPQQPVWKVN